MVFHVRWIFLTTSLRIPPESRGTFIKLNIMCKVADHENHVRWIYLTTVLCMGECQKYARRDILTHIVHNSVQNVHIRCHFSISQWYKKIKIKRNMHSGLLVYTYPVVSNTMYLNALSVLNGNVLTIIIHDC